MAKEKVTAVAEIATTEISTENEKPYVFRKLCSEDVFLMFSIISKIGLNDFAKCFGNGSIKEMIATVTKKENDETTDGEDNTAVLGVAIILEIANVILGNIGKCKNEIYSMLSNTSNMTVDEIKAMDAAVFIEMVIDFVKKPEFGDFIKVVSKLFK